MKRLATFGYDSAGKSSLLSGPEVNILEQREKMRGYRSGNYPAGIVRVELWTNDSLEAIAIKTAVESEPEIKPIKTKK